MFCFKDKTVIYSELRFAEILAENSLTFYLKGIWIGSRIESEIE